MLIRCTECNTVFEDSKTVCPNCGKERVVESEPETTAVEQINWWTKWGNMLFGLILALLFTGAVLLPTGIVLICQDDGGFNIGILFTIIGSVFGVVGVLWLMLVKYLNSKYRTTDHKHDKRKQEEYEQLIRDFLNSDQ